MIDEDFTRRLPPPPSLDVSDVLPPFPFLEILRFASTKPRARARARDYIYNMCPYLNVRPTTSRSSQGLERYRA